MQFIEQTWNNFWAYKRLHGLWTEFKQVSISSDEYEHKLADFLDCFIRITKDQIG
jgi:hypothetical protein